MKRNTSREMRWRENVTRLMINMDTKTSQVRISVHNNIVTLGEDYKRRKKGEEEKGGYEKGVEKEEGQIISPISNMSLL